MEEESAQVSLPGAGETESLTVLEQQNLGLVTRIDKENLVEDQNFDEKIENKIQSEVIVEESEGNSERPEGSDIKPPKEDNIVVEPLEIATEEKSLQGETDDEVIERILKDSEEEVQIDHLIPEECVPDHTEKSEDIPIVEASSEDLKEQDQDIPLDPHISAQIASLYEEDHDREDDRPPVPIKTYRWEDVRRAKQQGGYPWTHLYKPPLGPDDEPQVIFRYRSSPKNRRSFEEKLLDSPKSEKRVRIDSEVSVQDCCYPDILEDDDPPVTTETPKEEPPVQSHKKSFKSLIFSPKSILKRSVKSERSKSLPPPDRDPDSSERKVRYCHPLVDKLKTMAEKQLSKTHGKKVKKIPLQESNRITLEEEQKILKLKESPKAKHKGFTSYEERRDSDDIVEIVELDESPGEARRRREEDKTESSSHVTPDEIIELPVSDQVSDEEPKKKIPRRQEHVYEEIQPSMEDKPRVILTGDTMDPSFLHDIIAPTDLKTSLRVQDKQLLDEVEYKRKPLDEITQSSEESQKSATGLLAPICSVDSASDDERKPSLQAVVEESDTEKVSEEPTDETGLELKSVLKNEASPYLDKRVTFSPSTEDDADLLKEDVHLEGVEVPVSSRWSKMSDHEYEPIGQPVDESARVDPETEELEGAVGGKESPEVEPAKLPASETSSITSHERKLLRVPTEEEGADDEMSVHDIQKDIEERYFTSATPESRTDGELHTSAVDSSAIEDLPLDRGSRKKTMLSSAQDRGRQMQQKLRNQAGKLRTKLRSMKKTQNGSPKTKERKKFKAPEFTKLKNIHMPKVNKPEMPKFKRPEFTKIEFKKPDFSKITLPERPMAKFKIPEKFSSLKLRRSRSMKESTGSSTSGTNEPPPPTGTKKRFDFSTYPRIFDKMRRQKSEVEKPVRPGTPPPPAFATVSKSAVKKDSLVPEDGDSDTRRQYSLEEEEFQRESSLERRMRQHFSRQRQESEQDQALDTEEQRQLEDFDKENREIHEISLARQEEFKQRLPLVHQDSDLVSEESAGKWTGSLNLNQSSSLQGSEAKFDFDSNTIPIDVKEPRKGVIEQIDDDEFFLRSKGISQDNIQIGEYISSAIREGLTTPMNTLAQVGRYSPYYDEDVDLNSEPIDYGYDVPKKPRRVRDRSSLDNEEYFGTYPPAKPMRKHRNYESDERIVPHTGTYYNETESHSFYDNDNMEGIDQPDMYIDDEDQKSDVQDRLPFPPTPPKAPKRRRKLHRPAPRSFSGYDNLAGRSVSNNYIPNGDTDENVIVYRTEHEYPVPLATPETFTPIPTPRSRSRSQASRVTDDDRTSHGAESLISDTHLQIDDFLRNELDLTGNNGYAVVKKEPPPRPPPPVRRKKPSKSLGESQFATMPLPKRSVSPPARPKRNYSTIAPSRPPRTKSISSLGEELNRPFRSPSPDLTQYEEIEDVDSHKDLQSGEVIKKMKERPLPPPPRPNRTLKKAKKDKKDDKPDDDRDGGGIRVEQEPFSVEEIEVSTQTDPLPDDFLCEELEITDDMKTITPSQCKTLEDILKEEQEAEFERAQQLAAEQSLSRGLYRFREGNHRSLSERSKASTLDRPKTPGSRPISPNAVVVERKIATPTMLTEATLSVEPVDDSYVPVEIPRPHLEEPKEDLKPEIVEEVEIQEARLEEAQPQPEPEVQVEVEERIPEPSEGHLNQEEITRRMHDEVEAELERCAQRLEQVIDVLQQEDVPPVPPPRRKSSGGESLIPQTSSGSLQIRDLSVDRLNVNQLQAGKLLVSEMEGSSLTTQELECKSGNLVVKSIELPKGLIEEIVDRVRNQLPAASAQPATPVTIHEDPELEKEPPARPPPPQGYFYPYSLPPPAFYRLRDPSDEEEQPPATSHRRRRHHRTHRDSSEDEDPAPRTRSRHSSRSQDVIDLGGQFLRACSSSAGRSVRQILQLVRATVVKEENRNEVNVVAMLLIVLMASLILICMGGGDRTVHHHHWDFFNAPGNGNLPK